MGARHWLAGSSGRVLARLAAAAAYKLRLLLLLLLLAAH
jgi:hypothetical protein